jgi:uncharacterized protein YggU (UPF0235/DUF167 family)
MPQDREFKITDARGGAAFGVRVITRASETEFMGKQDDGTLKFRLVASPAGSPEANRELIEYLAGMLQVPANRIEIVAGAGDKDKIVTVTGISVEEVEDKLGGES